MDLGDFVKGLAGAYSGYEQGKRTALQELFAQRNKELQQELQAQEAARRGDKTHSDIASAEVDQAVGRERVSGIRATTEQTREQTDIMGSREGRTQRLFDVTLPAKEVQSEVDRLTALGLKKYAKDIGRTRGEQTVEEQKAARDVAGPEAEATIAEAGAAVSQSKVSKKLSEEMLDIGWPEAEAKSKAAQSIHKFLQSQYGVEQTKAASDLLPLEQKQAMIGLQDQIEQMESEFSPAEAAMFQDAMMYGWDRDKLTKELAEGRYDEQPGEMRPGYLMSEIERFRAGQRVIGRAHETFDSPVPSGWDLTAGGTTYRIPSDPEMQALEQQERASRTSEFQARQGVEQGWRGLQLETQRIANNNNVRLGQLDLSRQKLDYARNSDAMNRFASMDPSTAVKNPGAAMAAINDASAMGLISSDLASEMMEYWNLSEGAPDEDARLRSFGLIRDIMQATGAGSASGGRNFTDSQAQYESYSDVLLNP